MMFHGRVLLGVLVLPSTALADDLGEALHFIEETVGEQEIAGYEHLAEPDSEAAIPMLISRDVEPGAPLDRYDCFGSAVDQPVLRTSGEDKWALRQCMESRWEQERLPGYRTLGSVRLDAKALAGAIERASRETNVPAKLIDLIIRYSSGYRPGVVSNEGRYGLMQLDPVQLRSLGITFGDLLDAEENISAGARYLARLTHRFGDLLLALGAFASSPQAIEDAGRQLPKERRTVWFAREVGMLYFSSKLDVPQDIAVESMAFVWTWMD